MVMYDNENRTKELKIEPQHVPKDFVACVQLHSGPAYDPCMGSAIVLQRKKKKNVALVASVSVGL